MLATALLKELDQCLLLVSLCSCTIPRLVTGCFVCGQEEKEVLSQQLACLSTEACIGSAAKAQLTVPPQQVAACTSLAFTQNAEYACHIVSCIGLSMSPMGRHPRPRLILLNWKRQVP